MNNGFFTSQDLSSFTTPMARLNQCGLCGLNKKCSNPKMKATGDFEKKIMLITGTPGKSEDEHGVHFIGKFGMYVRKTLKQLNVDIEKDCLSTSAIMCEPPTFALKNEKTAQMCFPSLLKLINEKKPNTIITFGSIATKMIIRHVWKADVGSLQRWTGYAIPNQKPNVWICPTFERNYAYTKKDTIVEKYFKSHLKRAIEKSKSKPWGKSPKFDKKIDICLNTDTASKKIKKRMNNSDIVAFDYETNRIKPENANARILSCSVCFDGKYTIAFPWHGKAIQAVTVLLSSSIKKIAANMKFEERWTKQILGINVRRFVWDTMIAAHLIDNRKHITGLKFQSFVYLGMPSYDNSIKAYMKSTEDGTNTLHQINIRELLLYNGLDSLLTYKLYEIQKRIGTVIPV